MNSISSLKEIEMESSLKDELYGTLTAEKHRERNRVHAKRTRQRKKEMTEAMKMRLLDLQKEAADLEQLLQESNTASILICLGEKQQSALYRDESLYVNIPEGNIVDHLKSRVREDIAKKRQKQEFNHIKNMKDNCNNSISSILCKITSGTSDSVDSGSNSNDNTTNAENTNSGNEINSNNDTSSNDNSSNNNDKDDDIPFSGHNEGRKNKRKNFNKSCIEEKESCDLEHEFGTNNIFDKKERNRVHAKHTRDRKKLFNSRMQKLILTLEHHNKIMRDKLSAMVRGDDSMCNQHLNAHTTYNNQVKMNSNKLLTLKNLTVPCMSDNNKYSNLMLTSL